MTVSGQKSLLLRKKKQSQEGKNGVIEKKAVECTYLYCTNWVGIFTTNWSTCVSVQLTAIGCDRDDNKITCDTRPG